jgi:hypothetical protein
MRSSLQYFRQKGHWSALFISLLLGSSVFLSACGGGDQSSSNDQQPSATNADAENDIVRANFKAVNALPSEPSGRSDIGEAVDSSKVNAAKLNTSTQISAAQGVFISCDPNKCKDLGVLWEGKSNTYTVTVEPSHPTNSDGTRTLHFNTWGHKNRIDWSANAITFTNGVTRPQVYQLNVPKNVTTFDVVLKARTNSVLSDNLYNIDLQVGDGHYYFTVGDTSVPTATEFSKEVQQQTTDGKKKIFTYVTTKYDIKNDLSVGCGKSSTTTFEFTVRNENAGFGGWSNTYQRSWVQGYFRAGDRAELFAWGDAPGETDLAELKKAIVIKQEYCGDDPVIAWDLKAWRNIGGGALLPAFNIGPN